MIKHEKVVVIGHGSALEHEICNLGRSLGHAMVSISGSGRPQNDDPWVSGIEWLQQRDLVAADVLERMLSDCYAVVVCDHADVPFAKDDRLLLGQPLLDAIRQIADVAQKAGASKFVWVRTTGGKKPDADQKVIGDRFNDYKDLESDLLSRSFLATVFRPTVIFGQGIAMQIAQNGLIEAMPLEIVAMAALRASLEPDRCGIMERDAIESYGDAMMIQ